MATNKVSDAPGTDRIRWNDEEQGLRRARSRGRRDSVDSMAIRSSSRSRADPAVALPIQYRTV